MEDAVVSMDDSPPLDGETEAEYGGEPEVGAAAEEEDHAPDLRQLRQQVCHPSPMLSSWLCDAHVRSRCFGPSIKRSATRH